MRVAMVSGPGADGTETELAAALQRAGQTVSRCTTAELDRAGLAAVLADAAPEVVHAVGWAAGAAVLGALEQPVAGTGGTEPSGTEPGETEPGGSRRLRPAVVLDLRATDDRDPVDGADAADGDPPDADGPLDRSGLLSRVDRVLAGSRAQAVELGAAGAPPGAVAIVPPGVDPTLFRPAHPPEPDEGSPHRLVTVGRPGPRSGLAELVTALASLPTAALTVVLADPSGPSAPDVRTAGAERRELERLAARLGVADRLRLLDALDPDDLPGLIGSATLVVCPAHRPSSSVALAALAAGVPVVGTSAGALLDLVPSGVAGTLVWPGSVNGLVGAVEELLAQPERRERYARAGRLRVEERYGWDRVAARTVEVYRALVAAHRLPRRPAAVVIGAAGFLGSHLCDALRARGLDVVAVDDFSTGHRDNLAHLEGDDGFRLLDHDISRDPGPLAAALRDRPVRLVFHLASAASPPDYHRRPLETLRAGSLGTDHALGLAREHGARFVLASTSEVYGDPEVHPQPESYRGSVDPVGPRSVYDEAKRYAEALTMAHHRAEGADVGIARIFNTYGPRMRAGDGRVVPEFVTRALAGRPLPVNGDGSQTRSLCFVSDTVAGLVALAEADVTGPVNLGNPVEQTVTEIAALVNELAGSPAGTERRPPVADDPRRRCPDITLARRVLGWAPAVDVVEGLRRTIAWFAEQGASTGSAGASTGSTGGATGPAGGAGDAARGGTLTGAGRAV